MRSLRPWQLPAPLQHRLESAIAGFFQPAGRQLEDFTSPPGEPALLPPDSLSWQVFKNPVTLFIGGVAAVLLELAEPRVRAGVWDHTSFRERPLERLQRTALATVMTIYGPRSRALAMIDRVNRLHAGLGGSTLQGQPYRAADPELLTWVQATASFGFLEAYAAFVLPLSMVEQDRFYAEAQPVAKLYGAIGMPSSQSALNALFARMEPQLEPSDVVFEFLRIVETMPGLPPVLGPMQRLLVAAAVQLLPAWARDRLQLEPRWTLGTWQRAIVRRLARAGDSLLLHTGAPVQACRRLGLPDDYLYVRRVRPMPG